ncbi:MAG: radical SAM/Cys-rich domain protein [Acidobacteria bacterium]|nr:MAG: radical SAM/Cys-rich domain protein [Acidobacteriota bacterium]
MKQDIETDRLNVFDQQVANHEGRPLHGVDLSIIQVNIGLTCNLKCVHCHVSSGPTRKEQMSWETMELVLNAARKVRARLVDITGGAPEMNPHFRQFVGTLRDERFETQVRTNLTILLEPGYEDLIPFMAERKVRLVASLPCYLEQNVDSQRGEGVYEGSIRAIQLLNSHGYGLVEDLPLDLVYNPLGPVLPPNQERLEEDYRRELGRRFGIHFTRLHALANMPIGRFRVILRHERKDGEYQSLLERTFNPRTLEGLMCRHQISVDWTGVLYDCDFNLATRLPLNHGAPTHIRDFDPDKLVQRRIATAPYCFGCTAGCGSSCAGALVKG